MRSGLVTAAAALTAVASLGSTAKAQVSPEACAALDALIAQQTQAPQPDASVEAMSALSALIAKQAEQIAEQERVLAAQRAELDAQAQQLAQLRAETAEALEAIRGAGAPPAAPIVLAQATPPATDIVMAQATPPAPPIVMAQATPVAKPAAKPAVTPPAPPPATPIVVSQATSAARPAATPPAPPPATPIVVAQAAPPVVVAQATPLLRDRQQGPVGEAPPEPEPVELASLPEGSGVLTPPGKWTFEPFLDFSHGSQNRLVFRGVEIVTGIQIGVIEASDADRDTLSAGAAYRYGLTDRLELETRIPFVRRSDRVLTLAQRDQGITRPMHLKGDGIGDVEAAIRYQLTSGAGGKPIFITSLRVKSDTGTSPFEIARDEFGVASQLATGSGFWGVEPSISFLYPLDPVVIFGSLGYLAHLPRNINHPLGSGGGSPVLIGEVDPGDTISAGTGFGFALNPRFSFSLGYKHAYIFPTTTEIGGTNQKSESLQVGAFNFGWSLRLTERLTLSNAYEVGTTSDSPDMRVVFRLPYRF